MQKNINSKLIYNNQDGIEYIQFKKLLQYPEITHCYTLRSKDKLNFPPKYKDEEKLKQSYKIICDCLKLDTSTIMKPHQTHTDNVEVVEDIKELNDVDGMITNKENITLLTTSADCTSLISYDPIQRVIGNAHSGWKGTLQEIGKKLVEKMVSTYNSEPTDIICCICPCIKQCCFEVDEDVKKLFENKFKDLENIDEIIKKGQIVNGMQKYNIDTTKINIEILKQMGLKSDNIIDSGICTKCHPEYFHSYRVDKENSGRNAAIINVRGER